MSDVRLPSCGANQDTSSPSSSTSPESHTFSGCVGEWRPPQRHPILPAIADPHDLLSAFSPTQLVRLAAHSIVPLSQHDKLSNSGLARLFEQVSETLTKKLFPLSADPLLTLTTYNVVRGLIINLIILGAKDPQWCEMNHAFKPKPGQKLPPGLMPTRLQGEMHPAWIDMFPCPKVRDNMISRQGQFDEDQLCADLVGELCGPEKIEDWVACDSITEAESRLARGRPGVILWSDPWDVRGWELTPEFLRKWSWVLEGCTEIIESTNRWRASRDEGPIGLDACIAVEVP